MHHGVHNQISLKSTRGSSIFRTMALFLIVNFAIATPAHANASPSQVLSVPEVMYLLGLIRATNDAMATASLNPQNKNYRDNVRRAVSMLPAGIIAVAGAFKANKLHDADLPLVQSMLGGFVDVSAPDRYKEFFKKPDASLIPKLGSSFPKGVKPVDISTGTLPAGPGKADAPAVASQSVTSISDDIVTLKDKWVPSRTRPEPVATMNLKTIGYDESNAKSMASGSASNFSGPSANDVVSSAGPTGSYGGGNGTPATIGYDEAGGGFRKEMNSEISTAESRTSSLGDLPVNRVQVSAPTELDREKENFFAKGKQAKDVGDEGSDIDDNTPTAKKKFGKKHFKAPKRGLASKDYRTPIKPKYWNVIPLKSLLSAFVENEAKADCQGGQGEGEQSGSKAAEILMAIAMIIAAIAPMVVASIQANADKAIAKINADTTLKTAQMQADTSRFLANTQKDVALQQSAISQQIAKQNNDAQSQRLNMQLAELRSAREDAQKAEQEKRQIEMKYNQDRIDLAKKQADDNVKLAKETLNANLTQAGLVSGVVSKNSTNSLSVTKAGLSSTRPSSNSLASAGGSGGFGGSSLPTTGGIPSATGDAGGGGGGAGGVGSLGATKSNLTVTRGVSDSRDRLLEAVAPSSLSEQQKKEEELHYKRTGTRGARVARGANRATYTRGVTSSEAQKVSNQLAANPATGSSPGRGFKIQAEGKSDLAEFRDGMKSDPNSYYRIGEPAVPHAQPRELASTGGGHSGEGASRGVVSGAYRAPVDLGGE